MQYKSRRAAFTLVELMVVIGVISILIALLMPAMQRAKQQSNSVKCKSNLRVIGQMLRIYESENKGFLYPVRERVADPLSSTGFRYLTRGTNVAPHERWPAVLFSRDLPAMKQPLPYDPTQYPGITDDDPKTYDPEPFTPRVMLCPSDYEPNEAHSYILNQHLADGGIKANSRNFGKLTSTEVIAAGEKVTTSPQYHMEKGDYDAIVEKARHGIRLGSNFLYFDGHVDTILPNKALSGLDPWDPIPEPTTPTNP